MPALTALISIGLVLSHLLGAGRQAQAQATIDLGAPVGPQGNAVLTQTATTDPTTAEAFLHSATVLQRAAAVAHIKPASALASHLSAIPPPTSAKSTTQPPTLQITVKGPFTRPAAITAVQALGNALIAWANRYQHAKFQLLAGREAADRRQLRQLEQGLRLSWAALGRLHIAGPTSTPVATATSAALSQISDLANRVATISEQLTQAQTLNQSARLTEVAGYLQPPAGANVRAATPLMSLAVAALVGALAGALLVLIWGGFRNPPACQSRTA